MRQEPVIYILYESAADSPSRFGDDKMGLFLQLTPKYFLAWNIICLGFSVVCSRMMCLRGLKCVKEPQIANTPLQLELSMCFVIPINVIISQLIKQRSWIKQSSHCCHHHCN